jgi:hypothetical protein
MSFGTLYSYIVRAPIPAHHDPQIAADSQQGNTRTTSLLAIAAENNLSIQLIETNPHKSTPESYLALNPLGKIPTFVDSAGFAVSEVLAIAVYCALQRSNLTSRQHS